MRKINTIMNEKLESIYKTLLTHYGELNWWPARTPYEVMVGAVLTQNTAWSNVEKAIAGFEGKLSPKAVADADPAKLTEIIRPAGFFNQKVRYLKAVTAWYASYGCDERIIQKEPLSS